MPDDLTEIKDKINSLVTVIGEQLKDLDTMKDLAGSGEIDVAWMNEVEKRLSRNETIINRVLVKFNV